MLFIEKIRSYVDSLDQKLFYRYLLIILGIIFILMIAIIIYFYSSIGSLKKKIKDLNITREEQVRNILGRIEHVKKQRAEVNAILAQEESFKIGGYFNDVLTKLNLINNKVSDNTTQTDLDNDYRESALTAQLEGMNMQQLTELLNVIEQNKRVYTKSLEIVKSTKTPHTIEVTLTIATLQPKSVPTE